MRSYRLGKAEAAGAILIEKDEGPYIVRARDMGAYLHAPEQLPPSGRQPLKADDYIFRAGPRDSLLQAKAAKKAYKAI